MSESTPQGQRITAFAFYTDTLFSVTLFILLLMSFVVPLMYLRLFVEPLDPDTTALVSVTYFDSWWTPTTIAHLEGLKSELRALEERANYLGACELHVQRLQDNADFELWLAERGVAILRNQYRGDAGRAARLRQDINRIHHGDVDHELLNYRETIAELRVQRNSGDPESLVSQMINDGIDRKIRQAERKITELETWRNKVAAATSESRYESAWRNFVDLARRNAAAPLVEAVTRLEADRAGIKVKRHYEYLVESEWRHGRLSDDEAAFIRRRIQEEFMGGARRSV